MSMTPSRRTIEAMTLGGLASDNRTMIVRCPPCRQTRVFLSVDLVQVYGAGRSPHGLFSSCSKCGGHLWTGFGFPHRGEKIFRPVELTRISWEESIYDPDVPLFGQDPG